MEREKLSLFADDLIVYTEYPEESTKKHSELISEFIVSQDTKPTSKNQLFLYTINEDVEMKIKNARSILCRHTLIVKSITCLVNKIINQTDLGHYKPSSAHERLLVSPGLV